jgi:hypothetical protein
MQLVRGERGTQMTRSQATQLFCRIRLAINFANLKERRQCVLARLVAVSVLSKCYTNTTYLMPMYICVVYTRMLDQQLHGVSTDAQTGSAAVFYAGFIDELVAMLQLPSPEPNSQLDECRTEVLRTLTSVIYMDRSPRFVHILITIINACC